MLDRMPEKMPDRTRENMPDRLPKKIVRNMPGIMPDWYGWGSLEKLQ